MGYNIRLEESTARMEKRHEAEAYRRLCALNKRDDLKTGGSYQGGRQTERWFAWMPANYPEVCPTVLSIFEEMRFEMDEDEDTIYFIDFDGKTGAEDIFIEAIEDLLTGYMVWRGEEGETWKQEFTPGKPTKKFHGQTRWVAE